MRQMNQSGRQQRRSALRAHVEQAEEGRVREDTASFLLRRLPDDAQLLQPLKRLCHGRRRQTGPGTELRNGVERADLKLVVHAQGGARSAPQRPNPFPILLKQLCERACRFDRALRRRRHAVREEAEPRLPVAPCPDRLEQLVVTGAMLLQIQAEIEERLLENPLLPEKERDEQPPHPPIAVEEGMDRLELKVSKGGLDEGRHGFVVE